MLRHFGATGKSLRFAVIVSNPKSKNISLYQNSDLRHQSHVLARFAIVTIRWAWDAMDAANSGVSGAARKGRVRSPDERAPRTAKSCGPGAGALALRLR
jgi:hypothetical protein